MIELYVCIKWAVKISPLINKTTKMSMETIKFCYTTSFYFKTTEKKRNII